MASPPRKPRVSCVLAVDGGERLAKDWPHLAVSYVTAILRQLNNVHPNAEIQVAPLIINSLPPKSKRPLVVRPFRPVAQALAELSGLLGGKGKQRESTSDQDYALLEGLLIAASLLEAQQANHSYIVLVSAQDIPNTNFWDEEVPGTLPLATIWPEIGPSNGLNDDAFSTSQGWQRLVTELSKTRIHFCTITTRFLPRLEDFQRKVAAANSLPSQALPNLQNPEHAILLTGFQSNASTQQKRPHADSVSEVQRENKDSIAPPLMNGQNKRVKLSPNTEPRKLPAEPVKSSKTAKPETPQQSGQQQGQQQNQQQPASMQVQGTPTHNPQTQTDGSKHSVELSHLQQSPNKVLLSLASSQGSSQGSLDASAVFQPQQQQIHELSQQPFSMQDIAQKREEVKTQMKQFLTSLSSMAKAKQATMEQARAAAEQVRAEAMKKLQLLDRLEQQSLQRSPSFSNPGMQQTPSDGGNLQQSPAAAFLQLQQMAQQGANMQNIQLPQQLQMQLQAQQQYQNQQQQQNQQQSQQQPMFPGHQRTASFSSTTSSAAYQPTPSQTFAQVQPGMTTPNIPQNSQAGQTKQTNKPAPSSPSKSPPVWSGPIQWSLVDPQSKQKRELAFYVDAVPMRANAAVEMMNLQWPSTLEIAHISGMPMSELQKYASDNRIQVIQLVKASASVVESHGMTFGQNDSLYKLLAKSLEDKSSVATIRLPAAGQNRGIVVVALPGQAKLVGLLFLHTTLPPRAPPGQQPSSEQQQHQQTQQPQHQQHQRTPSQVQQQATQRGANRSQEAPQNNMAQQQVNPPLPSPSFQQQALQPFLQQMQMSQQYQQGQQNSTPQPLYNPTFAQQNTQQFNSPSFQANVPLPQAPAMFGQGMGQMPSNQFNFGMQMPQSNNLNQQMSDAQFQELLASLQK